MSATLHAEAITDLLYEGVLSPQGWTHAMQAIGTRLDAHAFHQCEIRRGDRGVQSVTAALGNAPAPEKLLEYETHYAAIDVRIPASWGLREGQWMLDHEHFAPATFECSPIYAEFLASIDVRHTAAMPLRDGDETRDFLVFMRHADQQPYGQRESALLQQLMPHLVRANRLRHAGGRLAAEAALGLAALDALPQCVAVLGPRCHVRYLNAAAERALAAAVVPPGGLAVAQGRLQCADPAAQARLARDVAVACGACPRADPADTGGADGGAAAVTVLPLQAAHPLAAAWRSVPLALVAWHGVEEANAGADAEKLARLRAVLGLSPTEARLALHLSRGGTVKGFCAVQGCGWHTARTHMHNLLRKTGCRSQAELGRLVRMLAAG